MMGIMIQERIRVMTVMIQVKNHVGFVLIAIRQDQRAYSVLNQLVRIPIVSLQLITEILQQALNLFIKYYFIFNFVPHNIRLLFIWLFATLLLSVVLVILVSCPSFIALILYYRYQLQSYALANCGYVYMLYIRSIYYLILH